jgi:hypothetical protein
MFYLRASNSQWLTTSNRYCLLTSDINNRLQIRDENSRLEAPGWQFGNLINNSVIGAWDTSAYFIDDNSWSSGGIPIEYLDNGQVCQKEDQGKRLCQSGSQWIYWSVTPNDRGVDYLVFTKVDVSSEEARAASAAHPSAITTVEQPRMHA